MSTTTDAVALPRSAGRTPRRGSRPAAASSRRPDRVCTSPSSPPASSTLFPLLWMLRTAFAPSQDVFRATLSLWPDNATLGQLRRRLPPSSGRYLVHELGGGRRRHHARQARRLATGGLCLRCPVVPRTRYGVRPCRGHHDRTLCHHPAADLRGGRQRRALRHPDRRHRADDRPLRLRRLLPAPGFQGVAARAVRGRAHRRRRTVAADADDRAAQHLGRGGGHGRAVLPRRVESLSLAASHPRCDGSTRPCRSA